MKERHQIMTDTHFWMRLEGDATVWLHEKVHGGLWIDGFNPEFIKNTKSGVDIEGVAWVANGGRSQSPYRFLVSVPQKILHRHRDCLFIEDLVLDDGQKTLEIRIAANCKLPTPAQDAQAKGFKTPS